MRPRRGLVKGRAASESVQPPRGWPPPTRQGSESGESEVAGGGARSAAGLGRFPPGAGHAAPGIWDLRACGAGGSGRWDRSRSFWGPGGGQTGGDVFEVVGAGGRRGTDSPSSRVLPGQSVKLRRGFWGGAGVSLKVINSKTVVKLTETGKLCNPAESLQVGRCAGRIPPTPCPPPPRRLVGSGQEGPHRRAAFILWPRTWIYRDTDQFPNLGPQRWAEKTYLNELDFQHTVLVRISDLGVKKRVASLPLHM